MFKRVRKKILCISSAFVLFSAVSHSDAVNVDWPYYSFNVTNTLNQDRDDLICIEQSQANFLITKKHAYLVTIEGKQVPSQVAPCSIANESLGLLVKQALTAKQSSKLNVYVNTQATLSSQHQVPYTYAELQVRVGGQWQQDKLAGGQYVPVESYQLPDDHTVGNRLFKYEGLGWESESMAYRYYFDHRGSIDIFAKQKNGLVLENVGIDGDDYHVLDDWGLDVLKVGPSLGLGGIAAWQNNTVFGANKFDQLSTTINSGNLTSDVRLTYQNWQVADNNGDLDLTLSINANTSLTRVKAQTLAPIPQFATGIVKHDVDVIKKVNNESTWSVLATWGKQSLNKDNLGMAIFFKTSQLEKLTQDKYNELVVFKPTNAPLYYYFSANWQAAPKGANTKQQYIEDLDKTLALLNNPIHVSQK
ncbi:DUF4861 domain-containing protein [Psychrosphaera sp. F3M07]|uniref:DUF4861 family protein n=1 Tax=Psychrosphaera sp. F3M07 TaxID=2841560 RepID=UPI001C086DE0|nr:DUF4861 family protein [Psychrosphaera sp. F3M07]MBU2919387.1 DUF4861 domain-containing protein [Psychrosphaera sp. F3M07]